MDSSTFLKLPEPIVKAYSTESEIAEKLEAIVRLNYYTSRKVKKYANLFQKPLFKILNFSVMNLNRAIKSRLLYQNFKIKNILESTEKSNKNCHYERPKGIPPGESNNDYHLFSSMVRLSLGDLQEALTMTILSITPFFSWLILYIFIQLFKLDI